jgi:taurine dioxygenase
MIAAPQVTEKISVRPLTQNLGAEIGGVDFTQQLSDDVFSEIHAAFLRYQVLLFSPCELSPASQVAFARRFGEVQIHVMNQYHAGGFPELYRLSNLDENGKPNGKFPDQGTFVWHTDGSWRRVTGHATIIYGEVMPDRGGDTLFCDMYGGYERLDASWKARIADMRAMHNLDFSRNRRHGHEPMTDAQRLAVPPVDHPVVRTHPDTGRKCLYLGDHAESIVGMPYDEGRALIDELNLLAVHDDLTYEHHWKVGQVIVWDNRCLMHRATTYDAVNQGRVIRRCTVLGEAPV